MKKIKIEKYIINKRKKKYKYKSFLDNKGKRHKKYKQIKKYILFLSILFLVVFISFIISIIINKSHKNDNHNIDYNNLIEVINKYKREKIIWPIKNYLKFIPELSDEELEALCYFMNPKNVYFEFGSGGSTNVASFYNMTTYSVESDTKWHEKLKNSGINANYITVDLKAYGNYGRPGPGTTVEDWKKYIQAYKKEYNADIILIDGRFRVACALDIFSKIRKDTIVLIHDYMRDYYHIVEDYYYKIKEWDTLAAFIKKPNISAIPSDVYNKYIYIVE